MAKIKDDVLRVLDLCTITDNKLYLPNIQLDRKLYIEVNKCLESIGGIWNKKSKAHVFDSDPTELLDNLILTGEIVDIKKELQYFPTPKNIVKRMIELAEIKPNDMLLEPSAGEGNIIDEFPKDNVKIAVEIYDKFINVLNNKCCNVVVKFDFLNIQPDEFFVFDKVVMNPPFTKQQDIDHILHAWKFLRQGGILVSIVSESPFFRQNIKSIQFRQWLEYNEAEVIELAAGDFKESGTMIKTRIIKVKK
jgi:predicted RNA methylase